MAKQTIGIIPARYQSTRLPGKPLAEILGKPMIQWVYERASRAASLEKVIVATDDARIERAVKQFGGNVVMTPGDIRSGSDRVAFVARNLDSEIVVNIQGDEPLIDPTAIDIAVSELQDAEDAVVSTLAYAINEPAELENRNTARVVIDTKGYALYFSRAAIPHMRDSFDRSEWMQHHTYYNHVGLYVFRKEFLLTYTELPQTPLEQIEKLEQLRILEHGYKIKVGITDSQPFCVDTPDDLEGVIEEIKRRAL